MRFYFLLGLTFLCAFFFASPAGAIKAISIFTHEYSGRFDAAHFSPDGTLWANVTSDKKIEIWDLKANKALATLDVGASLSNDEGIGNALNSVVFSPDSKIIATSTGHLTIPDRHPERFHANNPQTGNGKVQLWDARSGRLLRTIKHSAPDWQNDFYDLSFSRGGKLLAVLSPGTHRSYKSPSWLFTVSVVELWDVKSGKFLRAFNYGSFYLSKLDFSPNGKMLVGSGGYTSSRVWDVRSGKLLRTLQTLENGHDTTSGMNIRFASDSKTLYGLTQTRIKYSSPAYEAWAIWDARTGKIIRELTQFDSQAVLCADGKLVIDRKEKTIKAYNALTGKVLYSIGTIDDLEIGLDEEHRIWDGIRTHSYGDAILHPSSDGRYVAVNYYSTKEKKQVILVFAVKRNATSFKISNFVWCQFASKRPLLVATKNVSGSNETSKDTLRVWSLKP